MTLRSGRYQAWHALAKVDLIYDLQRPYHIQLEVADRAVVDVKVSKKKLAEIESKLYKPLELMECFDEDIEQKAVPIKPIMLVILVDEDVIDEPFDTVEEAQAYVDAHFREFHHSSDWPLEFHIMPFAMKFYLDDYDFPEGSRYIPKGLR